MANPDGKGGGGLSLQTLAVASAASVTAALLTSRLFPPGTIYASALTPLIVAAVSELLNRPAARVTRYRDQRRTLSVEQRRFETARLAGERPNPLRGAPEFAKGSAADAELGTSNANGYGEAPLTIHGRRAWGRINPKLAIATGLAAFAIAVAVLTLPELIFGGAVANTHRTTFFGGGTGHARTQTQTTPTQTSTQKQTAPKTVTETVPSQAPAQSTPTAPQTTPTDTGTATTPAPQTTPTDTGTATTPAPSGAAPPAP
jgi:hypothetical protein